MPFLNRYSIRVQQKRNIRMNAQNAQQARDLSEQEVVAMEDAEKITSKPAVLISENTGTDETGTIQLNEYEVSVRFRRNIVMEAEGLSEARQYAIDDQASWQDTEAGTIQAQQVTFMREKTGTY